MVSEPKRSLLVPTLISLVVLGGIAAATWAILGTQDADPPRSPSSSAGSALLGDADEVIIAQGGSEETGAPSPLREAARRLLEEGPGANDLANVAVDYPHDGSVFPPEFVPPRFLWHDDAESVDAWLVEITFAGGEPPVRVFVRGPEPPRGEIDARAIGKTNEVYEPSAYQASARSWTPTPDLWEHVKRHTVEQDATITFHGVRSASPLQVVSRGAVTIRTSADPVGAPIFYRDVPLMPAVAEESGVIKPLANEAVPLIAWRLKDVSRTDSKIVLTDMPSCANCHSFSQDGRTLAMDVDGPQGDKGTYAVTAIEPRTTIDYADVITWNSFADKPAGHKTIGFLSRISPDGRTVLSTVNEALYVANFPTYRFVQVFFPTRGILAWYSKDTDEMKALPGADDPAYVHCGPVWTPDGKTVVFCRAEASDPYAEGEILAREPNDPNEPRVRYDLYRIPFNGGQGGEPERIEGASDNGMSNTFPKISPDGRWIVYTKCKNGLLMRPDGRLWIVPVEGGEAREMRCNTSLMNSWHSFSPNGRWLVFSSKENTPYTQMFLTHVDEDGNDTPPLLIPDATAANRAVNIPEFVNIGYDELDHINVPAVSHHRFFVAGASLANAARFEEARSRLERAIEADPEFTRAHLYLGFIYRNLGKLEDSQRAYERALELDPRSPTAYHGLGFTLAAQGKTPEATVLFEKAVEVDPLFFPALRDVGLMKLQLRRADEALVHLKRAMQIRPRDPAVHNHLHVAYLRLGQLEEAIRHLDHAAGLEPDDLRSRSLLAWYLATVPDDGLRNGDQAVALALEVCERTEWKRAEPQDALAAAYAEIGEFERAVEVATQAAGLAKEAGNPALAREIAKRGDLYRRRQPVREDPMRNIPR